MELVDQNEILHYEDKLPAVLDYNPISIFRINLISKKSLLKASLKNV